MKQAIWFQRIEALALLALSLFLYWSGGFSWLMFVVVFLAIDLFMVGYLINKSLGAYAYNLGHNLTFPCLLALFSVATSNQLAWGLSLIWLCHVGADRALGFGLKHTTGFKHTHLGNIGKPD